MIKINNLSKEAFRKIDACLSKDWCARDYIVEDGDTFNVTLNSSISIMKPSFADDIYLSTDGDTSVVTLSFSEFSTINII